MKKLLSLAACAFLAAGLVAPVNAASGINDYEQKLLDAASAGVSVGGTTYSFGPGTTEYGVLEDLFNQDGFDLSADDYQTISDTATTVKNYLDTNGVSSSSILTAISLASPITKLLGVSVSYDASTDTLTVLDGNGNELLSYEDVVTSGGSVSSSTASGTLENTGENFMSTYAVFAALAVVLAGAGAVALRKKEVTE